MTTGFLAFVACIPILALLLLLVAMRWPATRAMPVAWAIALLLGWFVWRTPFAHIAAANLKGLHSAATILLIVFGALALLFVLQESGALAAINQGLRGLSEDRRVQAIIICWLFGGLIEGSAGFGTPAALLSPLLVSLGFPALGAVMVCLIGNTTHISFGPVGVPTLIGLGSTLNTPEIQRDLAEAGIGYAEFIYRIGVCSAFLHSLMAIFVPLLAVAMMTRFFGRNRSYAEGLRAWPYAIFAGLCYAVPYFAAACLLGPEFPTLAGSLVGLSVLLPATKAGFLVPKQTWDFPERDSWDRSWTGTLRMETPGAVEVPLWKAWLPYAAATSILVLTRIEALPFQKWMRSAVAFGDLFGTGVCISLEPLYNPGIVPFLLVAALCVPFYGMTKPQAFRAFREAVRKIKSPAIALIFTVPMVEIMQAGHSAHGWESMPIVIADFAANAARGAWPLVAPYVGAFGAFIAGSNTVSNMLFGVFQYSAAQKLGISRVVVLSLQNVGGAFGVLICVFKIIAACATVGLDGAEGLLIRRNALPFFIYATVVGAAGMLLAYAIMPGSF